MVANWRCVTLGNSLNLSEPPLACLQNGTNNCPYFLLGLWPVCSRSQSVMLPG